MKRDRTDKYYSIAVQRIHNERPDKELTERDLDAIWYTLKGMVDRGCDDTEIRSYIQTAEIK